LHHFGVFFELFDEAIVREHFESPGFHIAQSLFKIKALLSNQIGDDEACRTRNASVTKIE
jgi:hypothetical protein